MSDLELVALNITAEYMSINSELQLFRCISGTDLDGKIERSVYNMNPSHNKNWGRIFYCSNNLHYFGKGKSCPL